MATLHDFGGDLGRPLDTFCWALTSSWSQLLALRARLWAVTAVLGVFGRTLLKNNSSSTGTVDTWQDAFATTWVHGLSHEATGAA